MIDHIKKNLDENLLKDLNFKPVEVFKYNLRSQPNEINSGIATSLVFSAWNACTYVAQISDQMVKEKSQTRVILEALKRSSRIMMVFGLMTK